MFSAVTVTMRVASSGAVDSMPKATTHDCRGDTAVGGGGRATSLERAGAHESASTTRGRAARLGARGARSAATAGQLEAAASSTAKRNQRTPIAIHAKPMMIPASAMPAPV